MADLTETELEILWNAVHWTPFDAERIVAAVGTIVDLRLAPILEPMWEAYVQTGADTDGDTRWHCTPLEAARTLLSSVAQLRADHEAVLDELDD